MNLDHLAQAIRRIHANAQLRVGQAINQVLNWRNWLIGAYIVEYEQGGEDRAAYGGKVLEALADRLRKNGLRGLSVSKPEEFQTRRALLAQTANSPDSVWRFITGNLADGVWRIWMSTSPRSFGGWEPADTGY